MIKRTPHQIATRKRQYECTSPDPIQMQQYQLHSSSTSSHPLHPLHPVTPSQIHLHPSKLFNRQNTQWHIVTPSKKVEPQGHTYVLFSPFGDKNQANSEASTTNIKPMIRLHLNTHKKHILADDLSQSKRTVGKEMVDMGNALSFAKVM